MRRFRSVDSCASWLLVALGVAAGACGGSTAAGSSGSGGSGGSGSPGGGGLGVGGSGGSANPHPCKNPTPVLVNGQSTGLETCGQGVVIRSEAKECPTTIPRAQACTGSVNNCTTDADCADQPHGYCNLNPGGGGAPPTCNCAYGCVSDSECATGEVCLCGDPVGTCVPAHCATSADCQPSFDCTTPVGHCASSGLECQTAADECASGEDCPTTGYCGSAPDGHRVCEMNGCAGLGRPFLVEGNARVAALAPGRDFADACAPDLSGLSAVERRELAEHWTHVGLLEHASIAAFARFALQLLGLGAPRELIERANQAQVDETAHTAIAFGLASAYAGKEIGPGKIDLSGVGIGGDLRAVISEVIREGCVGETLAAIEAEHVAAEVRDPMVRAVLERIARDEARHAELAWRTVRWMVERGGAEVARWVREEFERAALVDAALPAVDPRGARLREIGIADHRERAELHRDAIARVILPCADAVVAGGSLD